jgi:hypothetical protein
MTPTDFLDNVVTTNVVHLGENRGNMRCAVNALLTLDAFSGILFAHLAKLDKSPKANDSEFRDLLSLECREFRIVRDAAFALKHGELTGKKPRLVERPDQVVSYSGAWDEAVFDRSAFDAKSIIWIEANDPSGSTPADVAALAVHIMINTALTGATYDIDGGQQFVSS